MTVTPRLNLPLVQPAQAQKHVTVNEALMRLDCVSMLTLETRNAVTPAVAPVEGQAIGLAPAPVGAWAGQGGRVAVFLGGGWVFITPQRGWRAWVSDEGGWALHDGTGWRGGALALSASGSGSFMRVTEFDHTVTAGPVSVTAEGIPADVLVFAVTARVIGAIDGSLSSWQLGVDGAPDRFGSGLGLGAGSFTRGLLGTPMAFYAPTPLLLTAMEGSFEGGEVRIAIHAYEPSLPGM